MIKGDLVLIVFPFTDLSGSKLRPAVVPAEMSLDITVGFITTQMNWQEPSDVLLTPNATNRLKKPSLKKTVKPATLDKSLVRGLLGKLNTNEVALLNFNLKRFLQLP